MEAGSEGFPVSHLSYLWGHQSTLGFSLWRKKNFFLVRLLKTPCNIQSLTTNTQKVHGKVWPRYLGKLTWWSSFGTLPFNVGGVGSILVRELESHMPLEAINKKLNRGNAVANSMKSLKKKTILICKREKSVLWVRVVVGKKKLVNLMCGLLKDHRRPCVHTTLSWSQTLTLSCLVAVPHLCWAVCIFFQTCLQVLLHSCVRFASFYKTKSAFIKRNIKK